MILGLAIAYLMEILVGRWYWIYEKRNVNLGHDVGLDVWDAPLCTDRFCLVGCGYDHVLRIYENSLLLI